MNVDTGEFRALTAAAELTTARVRAVHAHGYRAGHAAARKTYLPLLLTMLVYLIVRTNGLLKAAKIMYDQGRDDERDARQPWATQRRPRNHLRLVAGGGGRHAR